MGFCRLSSRRGDQQVIGDQLCVSLIVFISEISRDKNRYKNNTRKDDFMPRRNNRKIPRKEGELGFDPSQYIGKGNTPFPDNHSSDIRTLCDNRTFDDSTISSCDFRNIVSWTDTSSTAVLPPHQNVYVRNDTKTKRKKKRPNHYFNFKARKPTKRVHRAYAMIRKMRRGADRVIEALRVEGALKTVEAGSNAPATSATTPTAATPKSSLINKLQKFFSITGDMKNVH